MFRNSARHNSLNRQEHGGKQVRTRLHGQEISSETYAIAETDLLLEGEGGAAGNRIATFALENNLARISQCAVERRVFLVGSNPTQQLSLSVGSSRGGSWR